MNKLLNKIAELVKAHNLRHEVKPSEDFEQIDHEIDLSNGWHIQVGPHYVSFNRADLEGIHFGDNLTTMEEVDQEILRLKDQLATA